MTQSDPLRRATSITFDDLDPQSADAIAAIKAYFDEIDERFPTGFDPGDSLTADAPDYRPPGGVFVVAYAGDEPVACGGLCDNANRISEIKRMWVSPDWRGVGLGRRMLEQLEARAANLGYDTVRLDTNSVLTEAIAMYTSSGYHAIERYSDNPYAKHWFEKRLAPRR